MRSDGGDGSALMEDITRCGPGSLPGACGGRPRRRCQRARNARVLAGTAALALALSGCMHGDRGASLDPHEFIATAELPDDLRLELAAQEPAVVDPVAVAFDADGRMFVAEMGGYPMRPEGSPPVGRVKRLVDEDLDGYYETWTLFADGLPYPTSIVPWRDGVLVTAPPDILHLRDPDGDGVADARDVLFTGFPVENTQHNINGLTWGLDNWVYAANGGNHGAAIRPAGPRTPFRSAARTSASGPTPVRWSRRSRPREATASPSTRGGGCSAPTTSTTSSTWCSRSAGCGKTRGWCCGPRAT